MHMTKRCIIICLLLAASVATKAQDDTLRSAMLGEVEIGARRSQGVSRLGGAENGNEIGQEELFRAACCNLGESFVANPSVDVNYSDAAVGARQIRLLGLSGSYVQMLIEGLPVSTGASMPYMLGYVPGAWMRSIQVSKGASSVKNGFQSITGQIDVEYMKPDEEPGLIVNLYGDSRLKTEGNVVANVHLNKYLSTEVVLHGERDNMMHDGNGDGWADMPQVSGWQAGNRWKYKHGRYIMHAGLGFLTDSRLGGFVDRHDTVGGLSNWTIETKTQRAEAYMKHALLLNREHNTNLALMATAHAYGLDSRMFANKQYKAKQSDLTAQLLFEHDFSEDHQLSAGLSFVADRLDETITGVPIDDGRTQELTPGAYVQYTWSPSYRFTAMGGLRVDRSMQKGSVSMERTLLTPRVHLKWVAADWLTLRASAGKGYRSPRRVAENHYLLASGRQWMLDTLRMEEAWNTGVSAVFYIPVGDRTMTLNAEYYYTHFINQMVLDYDREYYRLYVCNLDGRSFSHTVQVDATYAFSDELDMTAAIRLNDVRCTYGGRLLEKPLQSRYKGLLTMSWKPMMALWHVDVTLQLNGGGRMPTPYTKADNSPSWDDRFPAYPQLNLQVARDFRHFSLYVGAENLTNYRQKNPVIGLENPLGTDFDPTLIWGPTMGIMAYAGVRMNFWRL